MTEQIIPIDLHVLEKSKLARVLQNELSTDFEEATVEWVDCPDLTQEPFNLAAPGLCGDTALLDFGGISNLYPFPIKDKVIYFKNILQKLDRTRSDNLVIGGGLCINQSDEVLLGELIMNASFSPAANRKMTVKNKSHFASIIKKEEKLTLEPITDTDPYCNIYGNFFVSKGLREQVLKVYAKNRIGRDFIVALQHAVRRFSKCSELIGFGGTFIIKNGKKIHHVIENDWQIPIRKRYQINDYIRYWEIQTPVVAFATFVSADRHKVMSLKQDIYFNRWHVHANSNDGGGYYHETKPSNSNTDYLGYFSPATKLYRINPVPIFHEMVNFTCLRNHQQEFY